MSDRLYAPAVSRNREPILAVLRPILPASGTVLEIASGSGEHIVHLAEALPDLVFQPSDLNHEALQSVAAWIEARRLANVLPPIVLDASVLPWPGVSAVAVICINMIHIAPWQAAIGLVTGAGSILPPGAPLYLYGPYKRTGVPTAESNQAFDRNLKDRDPNWGVRNLEAVADLARAAGFAAPEITEMPANNLSVVFRKL